MNLLAARVVLRPRPLVEVLDLSLPYCLQNRRPLGALALLVLAPVGLLAAWLRVGLGVSWEYLWCGLFLLTVPLGHVFTLAHGEALFREPREIRATAVLARFVRLLPRYTLGQLLRLGVLGLTALLVLLLPIEGARLLFLGEAVLLEDAGPLVALGRSRVLGRRRLGFCVGLWLACLLLPAAGAILGHVLGNAICAEVLQIGTPFGDLWTEGGSAFAVAGALIAVPVAAAGRFLGYIDLRTRKEGWDIQLKFMAIAEADAKRSVA